MTVSQQAFTQISGATLSEKLHTPPLPVTHVLLGYCWSHSRFSTSQGCPPEKLNNDKPSLRSTYPEITYPNPLC